MAAGTAFVSNILAARALGPELRGHIAFVLQAAYFVAPALIIASDRAVLRGNNVASRTFHVVDRAWLSRSTIAAFVALGLVLQDWRALIAPVAAASGWLLLRRGEVIAHGRYSRYLIPFISYQVGVLASHVLLYLMNITYWPWWLAAYALPALAVLFVQPADQHGNDAPRRANFPLLVASITRLWSMRGERLLLPIIAGPASLGLYVVIATATEPLYWIAQSLADHRTSDTPPESNLQRLKILFKDGLLFSAVAILLGMVLWFATVPIFGVKFAAAKQLILPLAIASVLLAAYRQVLGWILAGARPSAVSHVESGCAAVALLIYPLSIYLDGARGAAWASGVVYASGIILALRPIHHHPTSPARS